MFIRSLWTLSSLYRKRLSVGIELGTLDNTLIVTVRITPLYQESSIVHSRKFFNLIPNEFSRKDIELLPFIKLHLDLSAALQDTIDCRRIMKSGHRYALQEMHYGNSDRTTSLRGTVDPLVIRFTESKHSQLVSILILYRLTQKIISSLS
ncbi:hypothetical protein K501DRAFT_273957 [Backusella circina FSU 941]|nr:hypothetical protein K501DRAFT_273957 [Backusella circina FSU 941]